MFFSSNVIPDFHGFFSRHVSEMFFFFVPRILLRKFPPGHFFSILILDLFLFFFQVISLDVVPGFFPEFLFGISPETKNQCYVSWQDIIFRIFSPNTFWVAEIRKTNPSLFFLAGFFFPEFFQK